MVITSSIGATCNSLLEHVRKSGLNFSCQETPFLLYITVRKSFSKQTRIISSSFNLDDVPVQDTKHEHEALPLQYVEDLLEQKKILMKSLSITKQALENMQRECDLREEVIEVFEEDKRAQLETIDD